VNPFAASTVEAILENNKRCLIDYPRDLWQTVSSEAQDLVQKLTARKPSERLTAEAALEHPWFSQGVKQTACLASAVEHMRKHCAEYS
jgi:serine/threonine protein kinase